MKQIAFIILGLLLVLFGIAQVLQLIGVIGAKTFTISGFGFAMLGLALGAACFKKALGKPQ